MRRLIAGLLLAAVLAGVTLPVTSTHADVPQHTSITAFPTAQGKTDTRYRDGDDGGAVAPTELTLGQATALNSSTIAVTQAIAASGGAAPLTISIERSIIAPSGFAEIASGTTLFATDSTYQATGLADDTEHCFRAKVTDADLRESPYSNTVCATTPAVVADGTAPTTPSNPTLTAVTTSGATFSWTASTDAVGVTGYQVGRGLATGSCSSVAGSWVWLNQVIPPGTTSYVDTSGVAGQQYYYRVSAYDAVPNTSAASTSVCITTLTPAPPANLYQHYDYETTIPSVWVEPSRNVTSPVISTTHARMGASSVRFNVTQAGYDPPDGDRQELAHTDTKFNGSTSDFPYGQNICYAFSIYFPSDWVTEALGQIFHQWHNYPLAQPEPENPPFAIRQTNNVSTLELSNCRMAASSSVDKLCRTIPLGTLPKGKWLDLQIRYKPHWNAAQAGLTIRRRVPVDEADYTQVHHDEGTVPNIYERTATVGTSSELKKGKYKWAIPYTYSPKASSSFIWIDEWRMGQVGQPCNWDELTPTGTGN